MRQPLAACPSCGAPTAPSAAFCIKCGSSLTAAVGPANPKARSGVRGWWSSRSRRQQVGIAAGGVLALAIIGAVSGNPDDEVDAVANATTATSATATASPDATRSPRPIRTPEPTERPTASPRPPTPEPTPRPPTPEPTPRPTPVPTANAGADALSGYSAHVAVSSIVIADGLGQVAEDAGNMDMLALQDSSLDLWFVLGDEVAWLAAHTPHQCYASLHASYSEAIDVLYDALDLISDGALYYDIELLNAGAARMTEGNALINGIPPMVEDAAAACGL
jgi:hypothetical protein